MTLGHLTDLDNLSGTSTGGSGELRMR